MAESGNTAADHTDTAEVLRRLTGGAQKVLANAVSLAAEAQLLLAAGALSRALFLHQISLEECAKVDMLGAWATACLLGDTVDVQRLSRAFSDHKAKNYTNAYMLARSPDEDRARSNKRWDDADRAFKEQQRAFHQDSNTAKNASLYVDMRDEAFFAPTERITVDMVDAIASTNHDFLGHAETKVRMLRSWLDKPDLARRLAEHFTTRLSELRSASDDLDDVVSTLMNDLLSHAREIGYADGVATSR